MWAGSLFAGIGGLDLGFHKAELSRSRWFVENDKHCSNILARRFPGTPNHRDVTTVDWQTLPPVDVLHGGFPCQDISEAGLGAGIREGKRSGLWSDFASGIDTLRPRLVIVENVSALLGRGIDVVLGDLASMGFDAEWASVRASDVGAAHSRERIFIVAVAPHAHREGPQGGRNRPPGRTDAAVGDPAAFPWGPYEPAIRRWADVVGRPAPSPVDHKGRMSVPFAEWHMGFPAEWTAGASRTQSLKMLGNAVVPQVAELVGRWAMSMLRSTSPGCPYCAPDENCPDHGSLPTFVGRRVPA